MSRKKISSADEVRGKAEERLSSGADGYNEREAVTLPSGLTFLMRRPKPLWWALHRRLPAGAAAKAAGAPEGGGKLSREELAESAQFIAALIEETVISPKIRRKPVQGEVDPEWIGEADVLFIIRYAGGEVQADGCDLGPFPGKREPAGAGASGEAVVVPAEPDAGASGCAGIAD